MIPISWTISLLLDFLLGFNCFFSVINKTEVSIFMYEFSCDYTLIRGWSPLFREDSNWKMWLLTRPLEFHEDRVTEVSLNAETISRMPHSWSGPRGTPCGAFRGFGLFISDKLISLHQGKKERLQVQTSLPGGGSLQGSIWSAEFVASEHVLLQLSPPRRVRNAGITVQLFILRSVGSTWAPWSVWNGFL